MHHLPEITYSLERLERLTTVDVKFHKSRFGTEIREKKNKEVTKKSNP